MHVPLDASSLADAFLGELYPAVPFECVEHVVHIALALPMAQQHKPRNSATSSGP